jgi:preprotein translocase subunit SecG
MSIATIILLVICVVCLVIGLLLSGSGSTTGLAALSGQDLELFRKTKDRGFVKFLQLVMFFLMFTALVLLIVFSILKI